MNTTQEKISKVLLELSQSLSDGDVREIQDLLDHHEPGVAFENLCTQLCERDATCTADQLARMALIGTSMGIALNTGRVSRQAE